MNLGFKQSPIGRGIEANYEHLDIISANTQIRPLRDQMIVEPMDVLQSRILVLPPHHSKLIKGKVLAIGPGHYPNKYKYADPDKRSDTDRFRRKRTALIAGTVFQPTEVKIGQIVHLDGRNTGKSAFEGFLWGDKYCIHCREADVAGVET